MQSNNNIEQKEVSFTLFSALLLGYITLCGTLWHLGYWSTFGFNFLEYSDASALFKSTVYPFFSRSWILLTVFVVSFGISYGMVITMNIKRKAHNQIGTDYTRFNYSKYSTELQFLDLLILISISLGGMLILTMGLRTLPTTIPILFAGLGLILIRERFLRSYFKDDLIRTIFILLLALFAGFNFSIAKRSATQAAALFKYRRITDIRTNDLKIDSLILHRPFLGSTSEFSFILVNPTNVLVLNNSNIQFITIEDFTDAEKYNAWKLR